MNIYNFFHVLECFNYHLKSCLLGDFVQLWIRLWTASLDIKRNPPLKVTWSFFWMAAYIICVVDQEISGKTKTVQRPTYNKDKIR